jgi:hypothetical protein
MRPGDAIALAKERFGPERVPLRTVRQIYRPDIYLSLCRDTGTDPAHDGPYFPPYHAAGSDRVHR